ncbi:MAG: hypothetical protein HRU01_30300 [Myxococcales bacterium]|nr:hypothetical protein [Myxococcales bacterium]
MYLITNSIFRYKYQHITGFYATGKDVSAAVRWRVAGRSGRPGCRASRIGSNAPSAMDEALAIIAVGSYVLLDTATDTQFG